MNHIEMTEEERNDALQYEEGVVDKIKEENDIGGINGLFAAADDMKEKVYPIIVSREGKEFFRFHVKQLQIADFERLEKACRVFEKGKGGARVAKDFNAQQFLAMVIFEATTTEDKKEYWSNPETRKRLGTIGHQSVISVLRAGEIEDIAGYIETISGRENELKLGETVKN